MNSHLLAPRARSVASRLAAAGVVAALAGLGGCTSLSGYDANSKFACKAPEGLPCQPASDVLEKIRTGTLPTSVAGGSALPAGEAATPAPTRTAASRSVAELLAATAPIPKAPSTGMPLRTPEVALRVWIAPWLDDTGAVHDPSYVSMIIRPSEWNMAATRNPNVVARGLQPIRPPAKPAVDPAPRTSAPVDARGASAGPRPGSPSASAAEAALRRDLEGLLGGRGGAGGAPSEQGTE